VVKFFAALLVFGVVMVVVDGLLAGGAAQATAAANQKPLPKAGVLPGVFYNPPAAKP
jgi:hypothetical protein